MSSVKMLAIFDKSKCSTLKALSESLSKYQSLLEREYDVFSASVSVIFPNQPSNDACAFVNLSSAGKSIFVVDL